MHADGATLSASPESSPDMSRVVLVPTEVCLVVLNPTGHMGSLTTIWLSSRGAAAQVRFQGRSC